MRKDSNHILTILFIAFLNLIPVNSCFSASYSPEASRLYNEAVMAYRTRHFNLAKECFYKILENYPDDRMADVARGNLAVLLRDLKEYDKAIDIYKEIIEKATYENDKNNAKIQLVDILYTVHRYREGIELLEDWLKKDSGNVDIARKLAQFYLQSGNKDEAWLLLERFMEKGEKKAFDDLLDLSMKSGEVDKLLNSLDSHRTKLKYSVYSSYLADCYLALGRKDKAIEALKENKDYEKDVNVLKKLSDIQISANMIDDAIVTLDKLVSYLPSDWQCLRKLGHCYFLKNNKQMAMEVWKRPLRRRYSSQDLYINYTAVLIEHQMLEEALEAFDEARTALRHETMFAEEKAAVLESLGRFKEAMEENLKVLSDGIYKSEIFDKLYNAKIPGFSLEERLNALNKGDFNQAIIQALIELYFRKARMEDIDKLVSLIDEQSAIFFDDLFYDRLRQEALLVPEEFHFSLMKRMMEARKNSTLELKLAILMLKMPEYFEKWQKEAYGYSKRTVESKEIADVELKYNLYLKMAEFVFDFMKNPKEADSYLATFLNQDITVSYKSKIIEAKLMRAKLHTYMSDFPKAEEILNDVGSILDKNDYIGGLTRLETEEYLMQQKVELARLKAHMGQYQESLDLLKDIVENHKEGEWVNDGLELALDITRYSLGDLSAIDHKFKAERFAACGDNTQAISEINAAIEALPASSTSLIADLEADKIMLSSDNVDFNELSKQIKLFLAKYPDNIKNADIADFKIKLMQRLNQSQDRIDEEMRNYIVNFPSDLRSGKYKHSLENGGKK
ncbi:MAG: tetratricopeptide repeat protein [Candidatus Riflebacteria bacterium]|nr:tetratricopeptide repeat protein [Candidatus Riflebacteria bacterium]